MATEELEVSSRKVQVSSPNEVSTRFVDTADVVVRFIHPLPLMRTRTRVSVIPMGAVRAEDREGHLATPSMVTYKGY